MGTASGLELAFAGGVLAGVLCNAICLHEAIRDWRVIPKDRLALRDLARSNVRAEAIRLFVQLLFLSIFIVALFVPNGARAPHPWPTVFRVGFLVGTILLASNSVLNLRERRRRYMGMGE